MVQAANVVWAAALQLSPHRDGGERLQNEELDVSLLALQVQVAPSWAALQQSFGVGAGS